MFDSIALGLVATLNQLDAIGLIGLFVVMLVVLFVTALVMIALGRATQFSRAAPTLLTTLGILGTFLGIAIGLLGFDVSQVEYSIPVLLDGLKLAFITSIMGILLGVCLRLVLVLGIVPQAGPGSTPVTQSDSALLARQTQLLEAQVALTQKFNQQLFERMSQQHRELTGLLVNFTEKLSELGSRQLVSALEEVIRDFNSKLGEQFGENFRRLDGAVAKLLEWQDQYRRHMQELGDQLDHAVESVRMSETTLQALTQQAMRISKHVDDQEETLSSLRYETMELEALLASIAELRDKAKAAFPAIDERINAMLENIEQAIISTRDYPR